MAQESILFGSLAAAMGKVTPAQVDAALAWQREWAGFGVRKLIGQVLIEKGNLDARGVQEVLQAQSYKVKRLESKDYARIAQECGFATFDQLTTALAQQKDDYRRGHGIRSVGLLLIEQGLLTAEQHESVLRALNRIHGRTEAQFRRATTLYGVKECSACYEMIDFRATTCERCGAYFGEVGIKPRCRACDRTQEVGGEYCTACGANLLTGERVPHAPGTECENCHQPLAQDQPQCYRCGTKRRPPLAARIAQELAGTGRRLAGDLVGRLVLAAGLCALFLAVVYLREIVAGARALAIGADRATLERSFDQLRLALLYGDAAGARGTLAPGFALPAAPTAESPTAARERIFRAVLDLPTSLADVEILEVSLDEQQIDQDQAVTYAQVQVRYTPPAGSGAELLDELWTSVGKEGLEAVAGRRRIIQRRLTWRWQRIDGTWRLTEN